jgi:glycosyltransferase involved in cell wall biosynthesis
MKKNLINATNLHYGGGVQVAVSFINEIISNKQNKDLKNISIYLSNKVNNSLLNSNKKAKIFFKCLVHDIYGLNLRSLKFYKSLSEFNTVFTIFGPLYKIYTPFKSVVGFAQPWIIYPKNDCYKMLPFFLKIKMRLKYYIQSIFFKRADVIVVELEHVKKRLEKTLNISANRICVVHNCVSSIYYEKKLWQTVDVPNFNGYLRLGYLGRNYLHKNTSIFPKIAKELNKTYNMKVLFYVTFSEQEWKSCSIEFKEVSVNVGELKIAQCPHFYKSMDAMIFPSLLECFSSMPLETMFMKKPLFASDRVFNREICGSFANYFDPLSPIDAANKISNIFLNKYPKHEDLHKAQEHAINFSSPKKRAEKYLNLISRLEIT